MIALRSDLAAGQQLDAVPRSRTIDDVAKISVILPDDLVRDLEQAAHGNLSAFIAAAVRRELDHRKELARQHLDQLVRELEDHVGPVDEVQVARFNAMLEEVAEANAAAQEAESGES